MRPRRLATVAFLFLLLAAIGPSVDAEGSADKVRINVIQAYNVGCSEDAETKWGSYKKPDLRVSVFMDDELVLRTIKAQDVDDPWYAVATEISDPGRRVYVRVEVHEAEPEGLFGTRWIECDVAPGNATAFGAYWSGGDYRIVTRGDTDRATEVVVMIGNSLIPEPVISVEAKTDRAVLSWPSYFGDSAAEDHVLLAPFGTPIASINTTIGSYTMEGLCDNQWYQARVIRESGPWSMGGAKTTEFKTENLPPKPARILQATLETDMNITWESKTTHDVAEYEVHTAATADADLDTSTLRHSEDMFSTRSLQRARDIPVPAGDTHVWVRTIDTAGADAVSEAFEIGSAAQDPEGSSSWHQFDDCKEQHRAPTPTVYATTTEDPFKPEGSGEPQTQTEPADQSGDPEQDQDAQKGSGEPQTKTGPEETGTRQDTATPAENAEDDQEGGIESSDLERNKDSTLRADEEEFVPGIPVFWLLLVVLVAIAYRTRK